MNRKINDLTGKKFNKLLVLEKLDYRINNSIAWKCQCECGEIRIVNTISLKNAFIKSCSRCKQNINKKDIQVAKISNYLTLLEEVDSKTAGIKRSRIERRVKCQCVCGKIITIYLKHFNSGKYKSCGCKSITQKKDLSTITSIKSWNIIKPESKNTWLCACKDCKTTRILSYTFLTKGRVCTCRIPTKKIIYKKYNINIGETFGDLLVIDKENTNYICECYCGNIITTTYSKLKHGHIKDCGCTKQIETRNQIDSQFINKKFGRLTVLSRTALRYGGSERKPFWLCLCDCGKTKIVSYHNLISGNNRSCGCLQFEIAYQGIHFGNSKTRKLDKLRNTKKYKNWRLSVIKRDNSTCQICNNYFETEKLRAHHLLSFSKYNDLRYNKNNGITLCKTCHNKFHSIYTSNNFDINNFVQFKKQYDHQL